MSTVLQQVDPAGFDLRSVATIVQAYSHKEVRTSFLCENIFACVCLYIDIHMHACVYILYVFSPASRQFPQPQFASEKLV